VKYLRVNVDRVAAAMARYTRDLAALGMHGAEAYERAWQSSIEYKASTSTGALSKTQNTERTEKMGLTEPARL
jgi:hypothetical protein